MMYFKIDFYDQFICEMCGTCCRNEWLVTLDEESYQRNARLFKATGREQEFKKAFLPLQGSKNLGEYAVIAKQASGACWFLEETNKCRLHLEAGHSHLDKVCQTFPRYPMSTDRGIELTLSFSCPAVMKMVQRTAPLAVIRSEVPPFFSDTENYVVEVYPHQQSAFSPLHYYFELEHHFMDILQCRGMSMKERLAFLADTAQTVSSIPHDALIGQQLNTIFYHNYEWLDTKTTVEQDIDCTPEILLEHFFVNFIFKKPVYIYGLSPATHLLQRMWQYIENVRQKEQGQSLALDMEGTRSAIMKMEYEYSHNRRALIASLNKLK